MVYDFADYRAIKLGEANIPANRIYTHIAFPVFPTNQEQMILTQKMSNYLGFTVNLLGFTHTNPGTAFNMHSRPGFSTYPIGKYYRNCQRTEILVGPLRKVPMYRVRVQQLSLRIFHGMSTYPGYSETVPQ